MNQQVAKLSTSLSIDGKTTAFLVEPEPQLDVFSRMDDLNKSKKKKKKNKRKSLRKNELKTKEERDEATEGQEEEEEEGLIVKASEGSIEAITTEAVVTEKENDEEETKDNESGSQIMEPTSSLDTIRASGTRAVGSLLSRFKYGRKKFVPSPTEPTTEHVNVSPVKTAGKQLEVPKERRVDKGEQSVFVSVKKDQDDFLEEQKKEEKDAVQTTPLSIKLRDGVQTQAKEIEVVDSLVHLSSTDAAESDGQQLAIADCKADVSVEGVTELMVEVYGSADEDGSAVTAVETLKHETLIALDTNGSTNERDITTEVQDENVSASATSATDESTEKSQCSTDVVMSEPVPLKLDLEFDTDQSIDTTQNQVAVEIANNASLQSDQAAVDTFATEAVDAIASSNNNENETVVVEPLVSEMVDTAAPDENEQHETAVTVDIDVNPSVTESVKVVGSNENSQSETVVVEALVSEMADTAAPDENEQHETTVTVDIDVNPSVTESVKVVGSNENSQSETVVVEALVSEMADTAAPDENEQHETAVTVDIDVNPSVTESVKVVGSNENSQSKAISIDKSKSIAVKVTPPTSEVPSVVAAPATSKRTSPVKSLASRFEGKHKQSLDSLKFRTMREFFPEERSIRVGAEKKKYEAQAQQQKLKSKAEDKAKAKYKAGPGLNSLEKDAVFGASSPVVTDSTSSVQESVVADVNRGDSVVSTTPDTAASRKKISFDEGYAATNSSSKFSDDVQESLTPVKRIASRFEGKHEQSLDSLKFRTVREFFPDGGKRSIHVGAEKAKYEAIRKQQEEATMTAEHVRPKVTAFVPTPTTVERENSVKAVSVDASVTTSLSSLDEVCIETTSVTLSPPELKNGAVIESADDTVEGVAVGGLSVDGEAGAAVEKSLETSCILPSTSTDTVGITVIKEDKLAAPAIPGQAEEIINTAVVGPASVGSDKFEAMVEANEKTTIDQGSGKAVSELNTSLVELNLADSNRLADTVVIEDSDANKHASLNLEQNAKSKKVDTEFRIDSGLDKRSFGKAAVNTSAEFDRGIKEDDVGEQVNILQAPTSQNAVQVAEENVVNSELIEQDIGKPVEGVQSSSSVSTGEVTTIGGNTESVGIQQFANNNEVSTESRGQVPESASSAENGLLGKFVEASKKQMKHETKKNLRPILTTEQLYVMEDDHTIETVETVVVGERPMTDGEDDFEHLSLAKIRPAHEMYPWSTSSKSAEALTKQASAKLSPKLTRKISAASVGSVKLTSAKSAVSISAKCASTTALTASSMAQKTLKANESHKALPQLKKKRSAPEVKGAVSGTGFIKPPSAAPTVPVPMNRASVTVSSTSLQARNVLDHTGKVGPSLRASTTHMSKTKDAVGRSGFVKPSSPTVPVVPKRASITARSASFRTKNAAEPFEDSNVAVPSALFRNKKYRNVKSKVFAGIRSGSVHTTCHKTMTKEEFIAAERRKSLGSAGVRSVLGAGNRRASLAAGATIAGPPEPFARSTLSRKKLSSTPPRYMDYENAPGYAERARQQYERRKRLEEENAAKSEKRQRELRTFFFNKQQTSLMSRTDNEVRRGSEPYEIAKLANESEIADQKALRAERQRSGRTRSYRRVSSAASSAGTSSSNGVPSRTSKKSSVSSVAEKAVSAPALEATEMEIEEVTECTFVTEDTVAGAGIDC